MPSMNVHDAPIGVFDSGLGGLSVVGTLRPLLPAEDLLYFADTAHCPYGVLSPAAILDRAAAVADTLVDCGAKLLVVACNTASSVALPALRGRFPAVPIVGLVPAVKPAAALTRTGRIAVLATPRTVAGELLAALVRDHAAGLDVRLVPASSLVPLVEAGHLVGPRVEAIIRPLLAPHLAAGVDTLVLGCTHYPFLRLAIAAVGGPSVRIVDSGEAVARRVDALLAAHDLRARRPPPGTLTLLSSGDAAAVARIAARLLGTPVLAAPAAPRNVA